MAKRFIASLLTLCIVLSLFAMVPTTAMATTDDSSTTTEPTVSETPETIEPQATETVDYYLFGYINGKNYGCEEDHENMGAYKFVNGSLKVQFTADSYIGIKTTGNKTWYMTKTYVSGTTGTFYNTSTGAGEKMLVPGNKDVTFTLKVNADGTLTVSYVAKEPVCEHTYSSKVTTAANCLKAGVKTYTCTKCGDKYTEAIPAKGHSNKVVVNAATCKTYASYELTCTSCGYKEVLKTDEYLMKGLEAIPNGMDPKLFTNEPLYRYRTQTVLTSLEPIMPGYTQIGTEWVDGGSNTIYYVKSWPTGFDKTSSLYTKYNNLSKKVTASEGTSGKLEVNSDKVVGYLYYHWCYEGHPQGWSTAQKEGLFTNFNAFYSTVAPDQADKSDPSDNSYRFDDSDCENSKWWFVVEVYGQNYTQYDKQYIFGQWSEWTEWSTTPATSSANREVETITGYRFISAELADHVYKNGFCTTCGVYDPDNIGYHLIGYINGKDYGCETDYENVGIYRFVDGKLTATFTKDSYVFIKTSDNKNWYMASSFVNGTIGIFQNTEDSSAAEKMFVPANFEVTFTLVENKDGSLSLSYTAKEPDCNHTYSSKVTTGATCTTDGLKTYTCTKCGHLYSESIKASGHLNYCIVTDATCAEYATYDLTCTKCGFHEVLKANELLMKGLDAVPNGMDPKQFTNQPLYRYRTHKTATSYEPTMEGYTPNGTTWVEHTNNTIYYVKSWPAGFDKTNVLYSKYNNISKKVTAYENEKTKLEINSDKVVGYLYYHWCYPEHEKDWSTSQKEGLFTNFSAFYSTSAPSNYICDYSDMSYKVGYDNCNNSNWWFVVEVYGQNYSESDLQYAFETWSDWSEWSTTPVTETANREVETITGYRLISATLEEHDYSNGLCVVCGKADPGNIGYHLIGYINGKNYGCEEDHENVGTYRFINGKLTVKFTEESYVFIKTSDNKNWYMAQTYISGTTGKFYNTSTGTGEKMRIPGNVEVIMTLTANADGSLTLSYVTAATCAHTYTSKVTTAATCTKEGVKTFTCSKCGHSYTEKIAMIAHSYTSKVTTAATCTKEGVKTFTCSKCGHSYTEKIAMIAHSYTSKVTTAATCTTNGVKTYTCSACSKTYTETIKATGHKYTNGTCSVCGAKDPNASTVTGYVQVTDVKDILSGGKFIIVAYVNGAYKAMNVSLSSGKFLTTDVTVSNGVVTGDNLPVWDITAVTGGIALSVDGAYLNYNSSTNFKFDDVEYVWTVVAGENGFVIDAAETTRGLYYQLSSAKFGAYATSNATSGGYVSQLLLFKYQTASADCSHSYTSKVTTAATCTKEGVKTFTCSKCGDSYTEKIAVIAHSFTGSTCTVCGTKVDFYLFGFINGANYGCEEDAANMGSYKFVNGKLSVKFASDSYIAIKTTGNAAWYMTKSYVEGKNAVFHNTSTGASEKMFVPGGVTVSFTLVENTDGTLSLSYTTGSIVLPTLTLNYPSLSFEDEILYNVYYTVDNTASIVEMGLVTFSTKLTNGTVADAVDVIPGYINSGSTYMVQSNGIPAKNLGDALYFKVYAKLSDGSYVYSAIAGYHAVAYANTVLNNASSSAKAKALVVAMLNYGAAAQTYFEYKTDALMNASLTTAQQALVKVYDESMVADVVKADTAKAGMFVMNGGYSNIWPTVSFEGAFAINFYFTPNKTVGSTPVLYYWDAETYNSVSTLTVNNATGKITMTKDGNNYGAAIEGIAAKDMDTTIYVAGVYTSNGIPCPTSIISYSLGQYCKTVAVSDAFGAATAVYGYYAKAYFA